MSKMASQIADVARSQLAIVDVQTKLCGAMPVEAMQAVTTNCARLVQAANVLDVPVLVTEQYPQALGETVAEISQHFSSVRPVAKTVFSAYAAPQFKAQLQRDKPQIILAGLESHICVLQTALDLIAQDKQVFVVADAVISRNPDDLCNALARLARAGCIVTNTESVIFEWLGDAKHEAFKTVSQLIK